MDKKTKIQKQVNKKMANMNSLEEKYTNRQR